jgi:general secretion pathway protein C
MQWGLGSNRFNDNRRMVSNSSSRWAVAGSTFAVWALVAACAVYWGTKLSSAGGGSAAPAVVRAAAPADPAVVARLLGAGPAAAAPVASAASRFALMGVVASSGHGGAALIAVDGKPARPYRVGAQVDEGLVLQSVEPRRVALGAAPDGPPSMTLELPLRK